MEKRVAAVHDPIGMVRSNKESVDSQESMPAYKGTEKEKEGLASEGSDRGESKKHAVAEILVTMEVETPTLGRDDKSAKEETEGNKKQKADEKENEAKVIGEMDTAGNKKQKADGKEDEVELGGEMDTADIGTGNGKGVTTKTPTVDRDDDTSAGKETEGSNKKGR